jgi:hypothetical protein
MKVKLHGEGDQQKQKARNHNKNRARNYFWGSFGSPCSFRRLTRAIHRFKALAQGLQLVPTPSPD